MVLGVVDCEAPEHAGGLLAWLLACAARHERDEQRDAAARGHGGLVRRVAEREARERERRLGLPPLIEIARLGKPISRTTFHR